MTILDNNKTKSADTAAQLIKEGLNHKKNGDLSNAGRCFKQAVHVDPGSAPAYLFLGILANEADKPQIAVAMIEQAIALSPEFAAAYYNLGVAFAKLGRKDQALKNFEHGLSLDTDAANFLSKQLEIKTACAPDKILDDSPSPPLKKKKRQTSGHPEKNNPPNDKLQRIFTLYQSGNMAQVEQSCKEMLKKFPDSFTLFNLLGAAVQAQGRIQEAIAAFDQMLILNPDFSEGYYNRGVAFSQMGKNQEAVQDYTMAVDLTPDFYNAHLNLGLTLEALKDHGQAVQSFTRAIELAPDNAHGYNNRAFSLMNAGKLDAGLKDCEKAIILDPNLPEIHNIQGLIFDKLGKAKKAVHSFKTALQLKPGSVQFKVNLAKSFNDLNDYEQALTYCNQAVESHPNIPDIHYNKGIALQGLMRFKDAIKSYDRTIELAPQFSDAFCNRGVCFHQLEHIQEGFSDFNKAIELNPGNVSAFSNRGLSHRHFGQFEAAEKDFQQALSIKPDDGETLFNRALLYLLTGDFERGWAEYEWRWEKSRKRHFSNGKVWNGEPLSGKIIFIYGEQGFGDFIQFVRYLPLLKKMGARVILECKTALARLMANFKGYDRLQIQTNDTARPIKEHFDYHLPIMSLPRLFKTTLDTIPLQEPYLTADKELTRIWQSKIKNKNTLNVGIVWAGNPSHKGDRRRSISLSRVAPLKEIKEVNLYSLQKDTHELWTDKNPETIFTFDFGKEISDFADTAAIISSLDLIISVDTSVAHLAGALGKETWVLLPFSPDWRWLTGRDDSPWYPSIRLFRQPTLGDWDHVFKAVTEALKQKISQTT